MLGRRVIEIYESLIWSKTQMELIFKPCGEFRVSPEGPVSQIHCPYLLVGDPGIFSHLLRFVQMLSREWGAESNGKLPHLFIPSKTTTQVPEFAMEDLPFGRIAALVPEFAVKDLPLGRTLMMMKICLFKQPTYVNILFFIEISIQNSPNKLLNFWYKCSATGHTANPLLATTARSCLRVRDACTTVQ